MRSGEFFCLVLLVETRKVFLNAKKKFENIWEFFFQKKNLLNS